MTSKYELQEAVLQDLLAGMKEIMDRKGHDYSTSTDRFSNFEFSGMLASIAADNGLRGPDLAFIQLIATKMARIIELRGHGKVAKNEPIVDTLVDAANYFLLWAAWWKSKGLIEE